MMKKHYQCLKNRTGANPNFQDNLSNYFTLRALTRFQGLIRHITEPFSIQPFPHAAKISLKLEKIKISDFKIMFSSSGNNSEIEIFQQPKKKPRNKCTVHGYHIYLSVSINDRVPLSFSILIVDPTILPNRWKY